MTFRGCTITDLTIDPTYWAKPNTVRVENSTVNNNDNPFLNFPIYSTKSILLLQSRFNTGTAPVIQFYDLRAQETDTEPAFVGVAGCTVQGTAPAVIGVSSQQRDVVKQLTIQGKSNKLPTEMSLILPADLRETWKLGPQ